MKTQLRSKVAAALMLLTSVSTFFVAAPAAAQRVAAAPQVQSLTLNADNGVAPGSRMLFALRGTPRGRARVHLGGTDITVPLRENAAGLYQGAYTVRRADRIDPTGILTARLTRGKRTAVHTFTYPPSFQALAMGGPPASPAAAPRTDDAPPRISDVSPRHGQSVTAAGRTEISGHFDDGGGTGVDPSTVRLSISGRDVTSQAQITADQFVYLGELPAGRHTVEVSARDYAGNAVDKSWSFDVGTSMGAAPGPLPLFVSSPANNAAVDAYGNIFVQGRTAPWANVRVRVDSVVPGSGNRLGVAQTLADQTVQADGEGNFSVNVVPRAPVVPGSRYEVSLTAQQGNLRAESRITLLPRG